MREKHSKLSANYFFLNILLGMYDMYKKGEPSRNDELQLFLSKFRQIPDVYILKKIFTKRFCYSFSPRRSTSAWILFNLSIAYISFWIVNLALFANHVSALILLDDLKYLHEFTRADFGEKFVRIIYLVGSSARLVECLGPLEMRRSASRCTFSVLHSLELRWAKKVCGGRVVVCRVSDEVVQAPPDESKDSLFDVHS